jgi:glycosyltransferase involved in cell wall biosynthesis
MTLLVSVILCTHNPRPEYLRRTLDALRAQDRPQAGWELLVIDNASSGPLAQAWDLSWHPRARHIREDELGLTPARLRGISEAQGDLLVFVDDDNVLEPGFLRHAADLLERSPYLGAFGAGRIEPEFESEPSPELRPQLPLLALRSVGKDAWSNTPSDSACLPWGAGLCVTRTVAAQFAALLQRLSVTSVLGRRGQQLLSGEDDLFSWAAAEMGLGFGIFPALGLKHLISSNRLRHDYFVRLIRGHAFSHGVMNFLLSGDAPRGGSDLGGGVRLLLHGMKNGRFSFRCQWAARRGRRDAARFIARHRLNPVPSGAPVLAS